MSTERTVEHTYFLTDEDKVRVYFLRKSGKITKFIIQYYALISGRWRTILRVDTCHGPAHKHTYYLRRKQYLTPLPGDLNQVFPETKKSIIENFAKMKDNFSNKK